MPSFLLLAPLLLARLAAPAIEWAAPPECPTADEVLKAAEAFGSPVDDASLHLEGRIDAVDDGYRLDLSIRTQTGTTTRELRAESCAELTRASGLVLSVAVDPLHVPEPRAEPAPPAPTDVVQASVEPAESAERVASRQPPSAAAEVATPPSGSDQPRRAAGSLFLSGTLGRGIVPTLDARAQLGLAVDTPRLRAELLGFHAFAQRVDAPDREGVGARVQGWGGSLRLGPRWDTGAFVLACPVGVEVAAVVGAGFGVDRAWRRADVSWSAVLAPGLRIPLGERVAVGADLGLSVALRRPAFAIAAPDPIYRMPRVGARGGARIEVRFSGSRVDQKPARRRQR